MRSCEPDNETSVPIKSGELLDQLSDNKLFRKTLLHEVSYFKESYGRFVRGVGIVRSVANWSQASRTIS